MQKQIVDLVLDRFLGQLVIGLFATLVVLVASIPLREVFAAEDYGKNHGVLSVQKECEESGLAFSSGRGTWIGPSLISLILASGRVDDPSLGTYEHDLLVPPPPVPGSREHHRRSS